MILDQVKPSISGQSHSAPLVTWKEVCELMARAGSSCCSSLVFPLMAFSQFLWVCLPPSSLKVSGQRNVNNQKSEASIFFSFATLCNFDVVTLQCNIQKNCYSLDANASVRSPLLFRLVHEVNIRLGHIVHCFQYKVFFSPI